MLQNIKSILVKKMLYKSRMRGCKENDLIIGKFAEKYLLEMDEKELEEFDKIISQNDLDIYNWIIKKEKPPIELNSPLFKKFLNFKINN